MELPDNYFRDRSPADIIAKVGTITLANISLLGSDELKRIGWLNNPIIDILYSMTLSGTWIARTDASGRVQDASTSSINTNVLSAYYDQIVQSPPTYQNYGGASTLAIGAYFHHRYALISATSNAGGNLDADVSMVGALAGYYGVMKILAYFSTDVGGAATPTLVFKDTSGSLNVAQVVGTNGGADYTPQTTLEAIAMTGTHDNEALVLDTTSSGLGNTKTWKFLVEYWYET